MAEPYKTILVTDFAEIEQEFMERVLNSVWCSAATIDKSNRPRIRMLHPIWEGATGWITTSRSSGKGKHLAHNPNMALAYSGNFIKPLYVSCLAEWVDDLAQKERIWELFKTTPEPMGYDPAPLFFSPDHPDFGLLKLTPWMIEMDTLGVGTKQVWKPANVSG